MRVLIVEDEPYMAEAIRDGLRLEAIAADIAGDGDTALELLSFNAYDIAVLDRDIPGPTGDEIAEHIVASGSGMPILMLTAADRIDDKATGFELGADDYLTKPFDLRELVLRLRALDRRRAHNRPPVREIAGLRLDPFRREVYRDGRYVALTRKQFAVLEVLVAAEGGVVSAEELLKRAWDQNADPFTNAVRITVSALRKRLGEPWILATGPQRRVPRARRRLRRHARAARSTGRRTAAIRSQRLPRAAHPAGDHADTSRRGPQRSVPRHRRTRRPPPRHQHASDRPHRSTAPAQPRRPTVLHPRTRRPVPRSGRSHRNAPPPRRRTRPHHRDLRRHDPHHRLARAPAADDDEPRAQRDRPQPVRTGHRVGHDQRSPPECGAHCREHRRGAHPTLRYHAWRAVSARCQTHTHRPRRC